MNDTEREEFSLDIATAGTDFLELSAALSVRKAEGEYWFSIVGYLLLQLSEMVAGRNPPIKLTKNEMKVAVRAFTTASRAFRILRTSKQHLIDPDDRRKLTPFGLLLNRIWAQIPGQEKIRKHLPDIVNPNNPVWKKGQS